MSKKSESGAVTSKDFEDAFSQVPESNVETIRELKESLNRINDKLCSDDWEQKMDNLKSLRVMSRNDSIGKEEMLSQLKFLDVQMKNCISDLRSQVVKEACISLAFMTMEYKTKFEFFLETVIESLLNLVPNKVKIMSTSGKVALMYIVNYTQSVRILPYIVSSLSQSKSTMVRQYTSELVRVVCERWYVKALEKNSPNIAEALKKGIADADEQVRSFSREAFCYFNHKFPNLGSLLLNSIDAGRQKMLQKELSSFGASGDFKVPQLPKTTSTASASSRMTPAARGRVSSARSETNSVNNSNEYLCTKSQTPSLATHATATPTNYGYRTTKPKTATPRVVTVDSRGRKKGIVSQSQPSTRETSPATRLASATVYANGTGNGSEKPLANNFQKRTVPHQYNSLRHKNVVQGAADKLSRQNKAGGHDQYQSDDNMSETSSVVSDNLMSFNEIVPLLNSKNWAERKRGLFKASRFLEESCLRSGDRKSLIEIFNAMFLETQSAVIKPFLGVLHVFIDKYPEMIGDWSYTLLIKLLNLHASDKQKCSRHLVDQILQLLINRCEPKTVFAICCKFIVDKNHDPSVKIKLSLLDYIYRILAMASPKILETNNPDFGSMLGNIINWSTEKSPEIRKQAAKVVVKLFDLNSSEFSKLIKSLPQPFQQRANNILDAFFSGKNREQSSLNSFEPVSPGLKHLRSDPTPGATEMVDGASAAEIMRQTTETMHNLSINCENIDRYSSQSGGSNSMKSGYGLTSPGPSSYSGTYHKSTAGSATPQQPQASTRYGFEDNHVQRYVASQNTAAGPITGNRPRLQVDTAAATANTNVNNHTGTYSGTGYRAQPIYPSSSNDSNIDSRLNPDFYSSGPIDSSIQNHRDTPQTASKLAPEDVMSEILKELSNHNDRHEERKACLFKLTQMFRDKTYTDWDEYFKTLLFLLLETMADNNVEIRGQALRVLQELTRAQPERLTEFGQLTVLKVLEAHRDRDKGVAKAAEECSRALVTELPGRLKSGPGLLQILVGAISDPSGAGDDDDDEEDTDNGQAAPDSPLCLAALKMLIKLIKTITDRQTLLAEMPNLGLALSGVVNHSESQVRKETILCLVELHKVVGNRVFDFITLDSSKMRLLDVYINKHAG